MSNKEEFVILTGRSNPTLAREIGKILDVEVDEPISVFADGEIRVRIKPNLRRRTVFIVQSTSTPVNDHLMELLFMIDAAKRASATEVIAVIPYFGYSRQDRKEMSRVPISSSVVAKMIASVGADRILTLDIHSEQQEGFISKPWDNLFGSFALIPELKKRKLQDVVVAAPDKGGMVRATAYARLLGSDSLALVYKKRDILLNNVSNAFAMIGEVKGKDVIIVDDIIDTAGTIVSSIDYIKKEGARSVRVLSTHGLFSKDALEKVDACAADEFIITDSVSHRDVIKKHPRITVVSVAPLIAEAMKRIRTGESISKGLIL